MGGEIKHVMVDFYEAFSSEPRPEDERLHAELAKKRGCSTCGHCRRVINLPGFVTGEECVCDAGLQCDTVLFNVKDCPRWRDDYLHEPQTETS